MKQLESGEYTVKTDISCAQISVRKGDIVSLMMIAVQDMI